MTLLRSILMAFSCFSRIPVPKCNWEDGNMRYMLAALPLVALPIGLALFLWIEFCDALLFNSTLYGVGMTLLPVLLSGGIHMDGFCDTIDALASNAEPAKKRAILKDPHTGAFAVIGVSMYFIAYFAFACELHMDRTTPAVLLCLHALSRIIGALAALTFPLAGDGGMLAACRAAAGKGASFGMLGAAFALCAAGLVLLRPSAGWVALLGALLTTLYVYRMSRRQFGGVRGDIIGYLITLSELAMLICLTIIGWGRMMDL